MAMCGGPSRRSGAICAESGSVTSVGRAPREGGGANMQGASVVFSCVEKGFGGRWVRPARGET